MIKLFIQNRKGQKISVIAEENSQAKGLAFVMHGHGGTKDQPHIETFAGAFRASGFTVVRFDTTNTFGESDGDYMVSTTTNYYEDLEDVIGWASTQGWYREPFWLVGHSLGGECVALYAEDHPQKVMALAPISTVVNRTMILANEPKERLEEWNRTGWKISPSESRPGTMKKLDWKQYVDDSMKYDLLPKAGRLTMPVLLITGSKDHGTPYVDQKVLYDRLPGPKEINLIEGAPHTFKDPAHLEQIRAIFLKWIGSVIE